MAQSTSIQRVQRLIDSVPLTNLMFTLLSTSYKKVLPLHVSDIYLKPLLLFLRNVCLAHARKKLNVHSLWLYRHHYIQVTVYKTLVRLHQAYILQRQRKGSVSSDASASTDSNTYYEDDFSSTEEDSSQGTVIAVLTNPSIWNEKDPQVPKAAFE